MPEQVGHDVAGGSGMTGAIKKGTTLRCPSDPLGARTQDPSIKSAVLYQLS